MFIEPGAQKNGFAPAERNIPFVWTTPCAPPERWQCLLWISYKHLAALRPGPILSANFRDSTLEWWVVNSATQRTRESWKTEPRSRGLPAGF